jgi:uncharacterized membrane protein YidH (DUF202 family)
MLNAPDPNVRSAIRYFVFGFLFILTALVIRENGILSIASQSFQYTITSREYPITFGVIGWMIIIVGFICVTFGCKSFINARRISVDKKQQNPTSQP